jgi:TonB family protein
MKRCNASEFCPTIIESTSLLERLAREIRFLVNELRQSWPDFKNDPIGVGRTLVAEGQLRLQILTRSPNALAVSAAMLVGISFAVILLLSGWVSKEDKPHNDEALAQITMLNFPNSGAPPEGRGVGAGSYGRVGFAQGRGEGSADEPKRATGGGSGGDHNRLPAQTGRLPQPSAIPAPIPQVPPAQKLTLPAAGIDIDSALLQNQPSLVYGDPRSKSSVPSNGPGDDGGMGTAQGQGIGEGSGSGFGPGQDGGIGGDRKGQPGGGGPGGARGNNPEDPDRVYPAPLVTERARVLAKPEPQYTEEARRNQITGSVVLRVVFSRTGEVTNIRAIHALPFGLTERAIAAARQIQFRPATRDGRPVNVYMQLEYNFNLY